MQNPSALQWLRKVAFTLTAQVYRRSRTRDAVLSLRTRKRVDRLIDASNRRFVVFLVLGRNIVNGGALSIFSIAKETQSLLGAKGVSTAVCTGPGQPRILHYTKFDNDIDILAFADLLPRFPPGAEVMVHIPELWTKAFGTDCLSVYRTRPDVKWHFNILLQNIDLVPQRTEIEKLGETGVTTATTAHKAYATDETARRIGCPVHYLSTWVCPEEYERLDYDCKEKVVMVSPDPNPDRGAILRQISTALPDHTIVEIRNMTYRKYRSVVRTAKFAFTFGEGLDGYLVETIFSGGVAMAVYNERFFTEEYRDLNGIFPNVENAIANVAGFLKRADEETRFEAIAARQFSVAAKNYVRAEYLQNIKSFYNKYFS